MFGFEKIEFEGNVVNVFYDYNLKKMVFDLLQKLWFKILKVGFLCVKYKDKIRDLFKVINMYIFVLIYIFCIDFFYR